jgi:hypothetical protein
MMDENERALLASIIDDLVASTDGVDLTAALDNFGWPDLLTSSPEIAIATIFTALGKFNHWSAALQDVMTRSFDESQFNADGHSTVVIPWPRQPTSGRLSGNTLTVKGLLFRPRSIDSIIVSAQREDQTHVVLTVPADALQLERRSGLDMSMGTVSVLGTCENYRVINEGPDAVRWWSGTVALARVSICYSLVALMGRMVEMAVEHATIRYQFGRPIGTFQAVRHRAADSLVACESATAMVSEVWRCDNFELAAAVAKLVTSNSAKVVIANTQQILAGIGFTAEHEFHRYMKRTVVLDRLFDNSTDLAGSIGGELVRLGRASRLFEL